MFFTAFRKKGDGVPWYRLFKWWSAIKWDSYIQYLEERMQFFETYNIEYELKKKIQGIIRQ